MVIVSENVENYGRPLVELDIINAVQKLLAVGEIGWGATQTENR